MMQRRAAVALGLLSGLIWHGVNAAETADWGQTVEQIASGVVSLRIDATRSFDTERNSTSQATGFVVDAEQGLILTNRHVVTPGPVRAVALFVNQEEVALQPVYRDPVHDFGVFRYDPEALRYIRPAGLALAPEAAAVGVDVRIVGNDAGEQLSILSGTIARLDRQTPNYGFGNYNDFNTYYIQAATGSSGGSSGSPVLDIDGRVVALNAGASSKAASSFFLPLDRVKRAIDLIREGKPVSRGTFETQFVQVAYDELRRLGLSDATEAEFRQRYPEQTGMLVVSRIMPGGTAEGSLRIGDILIGVNSEPMVSFVPLEGLLDQNVGETLQVEVERNGRRVNVPLQVSDLHALTPSEFIQFSGGVLHNLSYQQAWHLNRPQTGIYVAQPGYALGTAGLPRRSVITEINGTPVPDLDALENVIATVADREPMVVRVFPLEDPKGDVVRLVRMDRRWFPVSRCQLDDLSGEWPCRPLAEGPEPEPPQPATARFPEQDSRALDTVAQSLVIVNFDMPFSVSGVGDLHYYGTGLVVDAERGYVVVDRNTVPEALGDVRITFAGSIDIPGKVEFIHPLHNLALLSYDPALIGDTPVRTARLADRRQQPGDELIAVGLRPDSTLISQEVQVATLDPVYFPRSSTVRFRESNLETLSLITPPRGIDGVLADRRGRVVALWSSFAYESSSEVYQENKGVPVDLVDEMLTAVRNGTPLHSLEVEFRHMPLSVARDYGLPDEWLDQLEAHDPDARQLLAVVRTVAATPAASVLRSGDLLLAIDGVPASRFREVEQRTQKEAVELTVWRNGESLQVVVPTVALDGRGVRRVVVWGGAVLQSPYRGLAAQRGVTPEGVYVAYFSYGSPASRGGLVAGSRIVEVNGSPVSDLDEFIASVRDLKDRESVRLTTRGWNGSTRVISVTADLMYWPPWQLVYDEQWQRVAFEPQGGALADIN